MIHGIDLLIDVLLLALAAGGVVDVWLNGSIFAGWRARVETWEGLAAELFGCSLCLNYQTALWLTVGLWALPMAVPGWIALGLRIILIALAVGRLAWLVDRTCFGPERGYDRGSQDHDGSRGPEEDP